MPSIEALTHQVLAAADQAAARYFRLVLLVGSAGSGKTLVLEHVSQRRSWPRMEVGAELSKRLLGVPRRHLPTVAPEVLAELVSAIREPAVVLDHCEILFARELALDPLRLLQQVSRSIPVVASWAGSWDGVRLTYAAPGHSEFREYRQPDAVVVQMGPLDSTLSSTAVPDSPDSPEVRA